MLVQFTRISLIIAFLTLGVNFSSAGPVAQTPENTDPNKLFDGFLGEKPNAESSEANEDQGSGTEKKIHILDAERRAALDEMRAALQKMDPNFQLPTEVKITDAREKLLLEQLSTARDLVRENLNQNFNLTRAYSAKRKFSNIVLKITQRQTLSNAGILLLKRFIEKETLGLVRLQSETLDVSPRKQFLDEYDHAIKTLEDDLQSRESTDTSLTALSQMSLAKTAVERALQSAEANQRKLNEKDQSELNAANSTVQELKLKLESLKTLIDIHKTTFGQNEHYLQMKELYASLQRDLTIAEIKHEQLKFEDSMQGERLNKINAEIEFLKKLRDAYTSEE